MDAPLLLVLSGRPGTGKTTVSRRVAAALGAALVRIDAVETALIRTGTVERPVGPVGYVVAHEIAATNLSIGAAVVIDAVNPVPQARAGWRALAESGGARLVVVETVLGDALEHRRRVDGRRPDLDGQRVPTWEEVRAAEYVEWDEGRDGPRHVVDTLDTERAVRRVLQLVAVGGRPATAP